MLYIQVQTIPSVKKFINSKVWNQNAEEFFMIFGEKSEKVKIHVKEAVTEESDEEALLDTKLNSKLMCSHFEKNSSRSCTYY